ncbi:MAG: M20 family metallopeptidase [Litoricola sp.]|jgi:glutamate carboxypeptidase|nr:M20 family metallopeptidase [Litorivicinus sp.]
MRRGLSDLSVVSFEELKQLVEINSYTWNKEGVDTHGLLFSEWIQEIGYSEVRYPRETIGDHLLFRSSFIEGQKRVLLLGHLDTVFPPGSFEQFDEDDEWVYGPGVCDMKGGNLIALQALRAVYQTAGGVANIDFLLVSDEEKGSDDSTSLTQSVGLDYDICLDFEAAGPNHEVVVARKGIGTFEFTVEGLAAHAGNHYADGIDANRIAAELLLELVQLTDLEQGTTVNPGKISGGIGANTISPKAEISVEVRFTKPSERDRVLASFEEIAARDWASGAKVILSGRLQRDVMEPNRNQSELLYEIAEVLGYPLPTERRGGVSDANTVAALGVATLDGFGPFGDGDHSVKERALKTSFQRRLSEVTAILMHFNQYGIASEEA